MSERYLTKTYKVGKNRGHNRVWIEGSVLLSFGWDRGLRFTRAIKGTMMFLYDDPTEALFNGKHTVAGTEARPIIDLNGKYLDELFHGFTHYEATFKSYVPFIIIEGVNL